MKSLNIRIEQNGIMIPVGTISGESPEEARFRYFDDYIYSPQASALSISLPLQEEPFSPVETANFFEGLLPEGFTRRSVAQWMHADETDYLTILHGLGRECLGAVSITEGDESLSASYEPITAQQVQALAAEGAVKSTELVTKAHLSLTGASGKVGLYYSAESNKWYLPYGTAASTHIVKQSHIRLDSIVTNEQLALLTAARCGIQTPHSFILNTGEGADHEVLFVTERYDRILSDKAEKINGLPRPYRLHQEDFAQALGIPAAQKYEHQSGTYMKAMFDILRQYSADPIADQLQLWDRIVFNYLIGNTDAHIKNYSLLYASNLKSVRLAPAYDIISTTVYPQSTRNMAFSLGGIYDINHIDRNAFRNAAEHAGLGEGMALKRFDRMCSRFIDALTLSAEELSEAGYVRAAEIKERILQTGGIRCT